MQYLRYLILALSLFTLATAGADWRKNGTPEEQLSNLVKIVPGTVHWMFEMGERYKNLYWAAKQNRWEFATYQVEDIEKLIKVIQLARPKRAKTAQEFLDTGIKTISKGLEDKTLESFEPAFSKLQRACMDCHVKNDHAFMKFH